MPINKCPVISVAGLDSAVTLPIDIINPHTGKSVKTKGIIDTGASECAIPAALATLLGHDLYKGTPKTISKGKGPANAYRHTTTIIIYHPLHPGIKKIFELENVLIDCMPDLPVVLLGVRGFLSNFTLTIDYPHKIFSLTR